MVFHTNYGAFTDGALPDPIEWGDHPHQEDGPGIGPLLKTVYALKAEYQGEADSLVKIGIYARLTQARLIVREARSSPFEEQNNA